MNYMYADIIYHMNEQKGKAVSSWYSSLWVTDHLQLYTKSQVHKCMRSLHEFALINGIP